MKNLILCLSLILTFSLSASAAEKVLLKITGEDRRGTYEIEETTLSVIEDKNGEFWGFRILSKSGMVNLVYTLSQLRTMKNAPIRYQGLRVLTINGQRLGRNGGELKLTFYDNVFNPFSRATSIDMDLIQHSPNWSVLLNDSAGRREISRIRLTLHMAGGLPVGIDGYTAK